MPGYPDHPKIGLALGGGGARGLAHIGVIKGLQKEGISFYCLSGSSMGGLIAAAYAAGKPVEDIEREALSMSRLRNLARLVDLSPPYRGLLIGRRVRAYLESLLGKDTSFDNLLIPLALTAVDLCTGKEVDLNEGSLVEAVCATMAVPGLFPPVEREGCRLVDGGLLNNIPADLARRMGAELVIAVVVSPGLTLDTMDEERESTPILTGIIPEFANDIYRAELILISAVSEARLCAANPEVVIRPSFPPGVTIAGFSHAREIIAAGEIALASALPEIRKAIESY